MDLLRYIAGKQLEKAATELAGGGVRYICVALSSGSPLLFTELVVLPLAFYVNCRLRASVNQEIEQYNTLDEYLSAEFDEDERYVDLLWSRGHRERLREFRIHWVELTRKALKEKGAPIRMVPIGMALETYLSKGK